MPLPADPKAPWPPEACKALTADLAVADAWYSGDEAKLQNAYSGAADPSAKGGGRWAKFWGRRATDPPQGGRQRIHVPAAADIAATSADLLFGEPPTWIVPEAHAELGDDGKPIDRPEAKSAKEAEERLREIVELDGIDARLLEAAELNSALGDVYLRPVWDPAVAPHPILNVVQADHAIPEFAWGHLVAVTFWREVKREAAIAGEDKVWRHLERHEPGKILHGLYVGSSKELGYRVPLTMHPATAGLAVDQVADGIAEEINLVALTGIEGLLVRHVPNVRPNRRHRNMPVGRPDTQGVEGLMDALDEAFSSWMRDIRLGKMRIIVPSEFLERRGRGQGASFDTDAEIFTPLEMDPQSMEKAGITPTDFKLRVEEHSRTCWEIFEKVVVTAGYSPQSFGLSGDGGQATATEVRANESRSLRTTGKKQGYWRRPLEDVAEMLLIIDNRIFSSPVVPFRPRIEFGDVLDRDIRDLASTLNLLNLAEAVSTYTKVKLLNPDWDETEVQAEVDRILDEQQGRAFLDPTGGVGDYGTPPDPGDDAGDMADEEGDDPEGGDA